MKSSISSLLTSYASIRPGVSKPSEVDMSHSCNASLTNLTSPVQVKPQLLQQMLRPKNFPSCSSPGPGPRKVEVKSYTDNNFCQKSVQTNSWSHAHQIIHMSNNTDIERRVAIQARGGHNWSDFLRSSLNLFVASVFFGDSEIIRSAAARRGYPVMKSRFLNFGDDVHDVHDQSVRERITAMVQRIARRLLILGTPKPHMVAHAQLCHLSLSERAD